MKFLLFALLAAVVVVTPVQAWADDVVYRIEGVEVDVTAASAAAARDEAIIQGQRKAFEELLARLGTEDQEPPATDELVSSLVQAFEIQKEHSRGSRYRATLAIQFRPASVRELFGVWGTGFVETQSKPVLVLPVQLSAGRATLWEEPTAWMESWHEVAKRIGLVPLIVPQGSLQDIATISTQEALSGQRSALQQLASKYGAAGISVVGINFDGEIDAAKQAKLYMARYDADGVTEGSARQWVLPFSAETANNKFKEAARQVVAKIEQDWRVQQKLPSGLPVFLPVDVYVETLAQWAEIRQKMDEIRIITKAHVVSMARGHVRIELEFRGDFALLRAALAEKELNLQQTPAGNWILR